MANNKIIANGETLIDLTADTVTAGTMVSGTTAHDRSGASITGTFDPSVYVLKAGDTMTGPLHVPTVDSEYGNASDTRKEEYELDVHLGLEQKKYSNTSSMYGKQYSGSKLDNQYLTFNNGDYTNTYPVTKEVTISQNGIEIVNSTSGTSKTTELKDGILTVSDRDLLTEFKAHTQYFATEIPANADLKTSTYLNAGRYFCPLSATAATFSNCPTTDAFEMDVDYPISTRSELPPSGLSAYILRTINVYHGGQWFQYVYRNSSGTYTWNDWVKTRAATDGGNVIKQIRTNDANEYQILFTEVVGRDSSTQTSRTRKCEGLYYNPASAAVYIRRMHTSTTTNQSSLLLGNPTADGTAGASYGVLWLYGKGDKWARFEDTDNVLTANRIYTLPNKDGELAILSSDTFNVGNRIIEVTGADVARSIRIGTKAGGYVYLTYFANGGHGLYSSGYESDIATSSTYTSSNKWIIRRNSGGNVFIDEWASIGGSQTPIYLSSAGRPVAVSTTSGSGTASTTYINTGSANYAERCGIVSVSFNFKTKGTADTSKILFTSLPKPKIDTYAVLQGGASATYRHLVVKINTSGQAVVAGDVSDNNITWMGSVTYPVA